jgi:hypothetical protein
MRRANLDEKNSCTSWVFGKRGMYYFVIVKELVWMKKKLYELRYNWLGNVYESRELVLEKIHTGDNGSDMLTKPTPLLKLVVKR